MLTATLPPPTSSTRMKQSSLFPDHESPDATSRAVAITGSTSQLSKAQKQFNKAIAKIEALMREVEQWREFLPRHHQRVNAEYAPLQSAMHEKRIAMAWLLDTHMEGKKLTRPQREKLRSFLADLVGGMLDWEKSDELVALYDKYSESSHSEALQQDMDIIRMLAGEVLGAELATDAKSPEELMELLQHQMDAREEARTQRRKARKKSEKALARESEQATAAQNARHAVRDVYRKLVRELHPDREPDPQRREHLTGLMQQANHAYDQGDLVMLLRLQLQIEQIDSQALAGIAEDRLSHYNRALREQSERLQRELQELRLPFMALDIVPGRLTPRAVERALDTDLRDMEKTLRELDRDLIAFQDVATVKQWLKSFRKIDADTMDVARLLRDFN